MHKGFESRNLSLKNEFAVSVFVWASRLIEKNLLRCESRFKSFGFGKDSACKRNAFFPGPKQEIKIAIMT